MITLLNTTIATTCGLFELTLVSLDEAKTLIQNGFQSMIGHESTCVLLSTLLETKVEMNRGLYLQQPGDIALCFKLKGRASEGKIMSLDEITEMGYDFIKMVRYR